MHAEFWTQIADALPSADEWCIGGDFNMLEAPEDRCGGSQTTILLKLVLSCPDVSSCWSKPLVVGWPPYSIFGVCLAFFPQPYLFLEVVFIYSILQTGQPTT